MSISGFLRGAARGAASVGRAVQSASRKLDEVVAGQPTISAADPTRVMQSQPAPLESEPQQAPQEEKPRGFKLPFLGDAPVREDAKYAGETGQADYDRDLEQYQHKMDIHEAFQELDRMFSEAHPGRDFQKEYEAERDERAKHEANLPRGSAAARFALALGDQNPAVQQSGKSNLADYDAGIREQRASEEDSYSRRMLLRKQMYEKEAADAEAKGNFKQALKSQEMLALMKADEADLAHRRAMEKTTAQQEGSTDRAKIRADAMEKSAKIRAQQIGNSHDLSGSFLQSFEKEAAKAVARLLGPKDLTKDYDPADLERITDHIEQLAEFFHDQQYGEGSSEKYLGTPPKKRSKPKEETTKKPTF